MCTYPRGYRWAGTETMKHIFAFRAPLKRHDSQANFKLKKKSCQKQTLQSCCLVEYQSKLWAKRILMCTNFHQECRALWSWDEDPKQLVGNHNRKKKLKVFLVLLIIFVFSPLVLLISHRFDGEKRRSGYGWTHWFWNVYDHGQPSQRWETAEGNGGLCAALGRSQRWWRGRYQPLSWNLTIQIKITHTPNLTDGWLNNKILSKQMHPDSLQWWGDAQPQLQAWVPLLGKKYTNMEKQFRQSVYLQMLHLCTRSGRLAEF